MITIFMVLATIAKYEILVGLLLGIFNWLVGNFVQVHIILPTFFATLFNVFNIAIANESIFIISFCSQLIIAILYLLIEQKTIRAILTVFFTIFAYDFVASLTNFSSYIEIPFLTPL